MTDIIDFKVKIDENNKYESDQNWVSGCLLVSVNEPISIQSIWGQLILESRGKLGSKKIPLNNFKLDGLKELKPSETYAFPFKFQNTSNVESYGGENVSFFFKLNFKIELSKEDYQKLKKGVSSKIKRLFIKDDNKIEHSEYIELRNKTKNYETLATDKKMEAGGNSALSVLFFLINIIILLLTYQKYGITYVVVVFIALGIIWKLLKYIIHQFLGNVKMKINHMDEANFTCMLENDKDWKYFKKGIIKYNVEEEVVDNRGTSSYTYRHVIHTSKTKFFSGGDELHDFIFEYPKEKYLNTVRVGDASIKWWIHVEMATRLGVTLDYKGEFKVVKK